MSARAPTASAPIGRASACAPAATTLSKRRRAARIRPRAASSRCARAAPAVARIPAAAIRRRHRSGYWNRSRSRSAHQRRGSALRRKCRRPSDASVSGQSPTTAPDAANTRISCPVVWVAWTTHQRASSPALSSSHCTGGRPSAAMQSSTSFVCSAAWMWIGPSGTAAQTTCSACGVDRAQRMRSDADAASGQARRDRPRALDHREKPVGIIRRSGAGRHPRVRRRNRHWHSMTAAG